MTEDTNIRRLDDDTVRQIAAGEVVERPASVVKELVENSLDADADRVDVTVADGGTERIAVSDDGVGMSEADVRAAVREHTTSKIEGIDDLESGVGTLGFRGEALYTIGGVSRTTITTKPRSGVGTDETTTSGDAATELRLAGGEVESVRPAGRPAGTTVEVTDLFYNTPARRKYLKTTTTEFSHVNAVVTRYALANPDVAVSLTHDGREVFATAGRGDLQSALLSVYGREVATSMIRVEGEATAGEDGGATGEDGGATTGEDGGATTGEGGDVAVSGYVSDPETTRSSREYLSTYVGGRYVRSPVVREAVLSAYGGQLAADRYPFAVLFVDVPGDEVDVNVHPRKMEVRWGDEAAVRAAVESAVEDALLDHGLVRSSAPRGRSAPDETRIEPERDDPDEADPARDDAASGEAEATPTADETESVGGTDDQATLVSSNSREQATLDAGADAESSASTDRNAQSSADASGPADESAGPDANAETSATPNAAAETSATPDPRPRESGASKAKPSEREPGERASAGHDRPTRASADRKFDPPTESASLSGGTTETPEFERLPRMRVLGQLHDTYLVAETPDGLVLVDQHAADERVNYERLRAAFADDATAQMLADPVTLELTAGEAAVFDDYREPLERLGFRAERAGPRSDERGSANGASGDTASRAEPASANGASGDTASPTDGRRVTVRTAPTVLDETLDPELLRDALGEFVSTDPDDRGDTVEAVADDLLADLACYPSITGNTSLREGSVVDLLSALDDCENPYACPHGRPVLVEFDAEEIGERFERDYPGHGGRRRE